MEAIITQTAAPLLREPLGPDETEMVDEALYGQTASILEEAGEYYKVKMSYRYEGYVHRSAVAEIDGNAREYLSGLHVVAIAPFLDVKAADEVSSPTIATVPRGAKLAIREVREDGWSKVLTISGRPGYVKSAATFQEIDDIKDSFPEDQARDLIALFAHAYLGAQYRWGGKTHAGIDCSGLCHISYLMAGVEIYRDASIQEGFAMRKIPFEEAGKADLIYYPGHVVMYLGDGSYIHSTAYAQNPGVVINSYLKGHEGYRADLDGTQIYCGTIF